MTGRHTLTATIVVALLFSALVINHFFSERQLQPFEEQASSLVAPAAISAQQENSTLPDTDNTQHERTSLGNKNRTDPDITPAALDAEESVDTNTTFSDRISALFERRREDSATFITKDDLPLEFQQQLDQALESYKRNGYLDTNEAYIEHLNAIYNQIVPLDPDDLANTVELQAIENTSFSDMEYIGAIPDRDPEHKEIPIHGIKRIFKHEEGYVTLYEGNLKNSEALLQKEFVNKTVSGYPATQITYCAPSERCFTQLVFMTKNKRYELSFNGDIERLGSDDLVAIAQSLNLEPQPNTAGDEK